jgi:hypothetical protein
MNVLQTNFEISKKDCIAISLRIREKIYKQRKSLKTSLFLCGADKNNKSTTRFKIAQALSDRWNSYNFDLVFPEDIFDELLYSSKGKDLLSLENLLAESIDVIIIIPESPGSFAELGAFANDEKLRNKIICLLDEKYKKDRSFINQGPVKLVKNASKHGVIFIDPNNLAKNFQKIQASIREVKKSNPPPPSKKINLLQLDNFLLPVIYLLEPASKTTIINCIEAVNNDVKNSFQIATTVLTMLTKKKFIELTHLGYKLTNLGVEQYFEMNKISTRIKTQDQTIELDNLRLEILNLKLRNKNIKT